MLDKNVATARSRFAKIMAARNTSKELIALVGKLAGSEKFLPYVKPYCLADLIWVCTEWVADGDLDDLLTALKTAWAGDILQRGYPDDELDHVVKGLVRRALSPALTDEAFSLRLDLLIQAGLITSPEKTVALAGLSVTGQHRLEEALARRAAKPKMEVTCPF